MPKPPATTPGAVTRETCNLIIPCTSAPKQDPKTRSLHDTQAHLADYSTDINLTQVDSASGDGQGEPSPDISCIGCGNTRINLVKMPDYSTHYAARRCAICDVFRGWEPKPATQAKQQRRQTTINQLLKFSQLSQWERNFLEGLQSKKLSPKQQECLAKIEAKVEDAQ